jgi:HEAT repeat protein
MGYSDVPWELARLMADPDRQCRIAAIRALGHSGAVAGLPLLEYKVLATTTDTEVAAECFGSMVQIDPRKGLEFAATYLDSPDAIMAESAALAVGESRRPEAFGILTERLAGGRFDLGLRRTLLMAIGLLRTDQAMDYLIETLTTAPPKAAIDAVAALALYKKDAKLRDRVAAVVNQRDDATIRDAFDKEFR